MGFFSRHRKAFKSVIASFGMLFGLLAGVSVTANVAYAGTSGTLNKYTISSLVSVGEKKGEKDGVWRFGESSISGLVNGSSTWGWGDLVIPIKKYGTIQITNIAKATIGVSFNWSASVSSGGSLSVAGQQYSGTQNNIHYENISLGAGKNIEIALMAKGEKNTTTIEISDFTVSKIGTPNITFLPAEHGVFSVDGVEIENATSLTKNSWAGYELSATPNANYDFFGWQVSNSDGSNPVIISHENPYLLKTGSDSRVTAVFKAGTGFAVFRNDSLLFDNLADAIIHANGSSDKTIVLVRSGEVKAGNYVLKSDLSLLIPNSETSSVDDYGTGDPKYVKNTASHCVQYSKLTFQSGANLTVDGQVVVCCTPAFKSVSSNEFNCHTAIPSGAYGRIDMQQGSTMILQSGAKLFAWGFVTGDGLVEAKNGSTVYELFQMSSWRGGSLASEMNKNKYKVFIVNQYYVQNVECALKMWAGATEKTLTGMFLSLKGEEKTPHPCFTFIGTDGMFKMSNGYLIKKYDPNADRLSIDIYGSGVLSALSFSLTAIISIDLDSKDYALPINNNISVAIKSGSACSTNQDLGFLPGSELIIERGASFEVQSGHNLTFYDLDNWGNYATEAKLRPVVYSPTRTKTRTEADLTDAKLALDGTLTIDSKSYLMTTGKSTDTNIGARIISPGRTGIIKFTDANATSYPPVYQYDGNSADKYVAIDHSCAKLQNGDHSYTQSAPGNTYSYDKVLDRWSLSTDHATKTGLFKTIDNNGVIKTVLLENDVMSTGRSGLFHYSPSTYKAGDNHYYYLQSGVVVSNKKWYQENGKWYFFGTNQYAYQNMSAVFTASTGITGFGIQARYFFNDAATVERLVTVGNVVGLSQDITIGTIGSDSYCYYKSVKAGIGLFEKQSGPNYSVYLAKDDGSLMKDGTYYVPSHKINSIKDSSGKALTAGLYYFDDNGHMYDSNFKVITRGNAS